MGLSYAGTVALIDEFLPDYDVHESHAIRIAAPANIVRRAAETWKPESSALWRWLLRVRGLGRPRGSLREWAAAHGFLCLADTAEEIVYGQVGRFWAANERAALVSPRSMEEFRRFSDPGYAAAVINVRFLAVSPQRTLVTTETRVRALGTRARRRFGLYWLIIRPFSGLLRRAMLRGIAASALAAAQRGEGSTWTR